MAQSKQIILNFASLNGDLVGSLQDCCKIFRKMFLEFKILSIFAPVNMYEHIE